MRKLLCAGLLLRALAQCLSQRPEGRRVHLHSQTVKRVVERLAHGVGQAGIIDAGGMFGKAGLDVRYALVTVIGDLVDPRKHTGNIDLDISRVAVSSNPCPAQLVMEHPLVQRHRLRNLLDRPDDTEVKVLAVGLPPGVEVAVGGIAPPHLGLPLSDRGTGLRLRSFLRLLFLPCLAVGFRRIGLFLRLLTASALHGLQPALRLGKQAWAGGGVSLLGVDGADHLVKGSQTRRHRTVRLRH